MKRIKFVGKHWIAPELQVLVSGETSESVYSCSTVQRKQVTRGFIFVFIYIELSQIYKSIFKLNIKGNSHIVQDERKQISCHRNTRESKFRVSNHHLHGDAKMQLGCSFGLCLWLKISRNIGIS